MGEGGEGEWVLNALRLDSLGEFFGNPHIPHRLASVCLPLLVSETIFTERSRFIVACKLDLIPDVFAYTSSFAHQSSSSLSKLDSRRMSACAIM